MKYIAILCLSIILAACGEFVGHESDSSCFENCSPGNNSHNDKVVNLDATISGGVHDGSPAISYDKESKVITLSLPLTGASYIEADKSGYDLPGISSAYLNVVEPSTSVTRIDLDLALTDLLKNHSIDQTSSLPNGQAIPAFDEGDHGYVDLDINGTSVRIYLSKGHLGIYIEAAFDPYVQVSYPLINKDDQVLGYQTQIPALAHSSGAFFSSLVLPDEALQILQNQL